MHITGVSIKGLPPLENILFRCNKRVNLFVGPNATGKSTNPSQSKWTLFYGSQRRGFE